MRWADGDTQGLLVYMPGEYNKQHTYKGRYFEIAGVAFIEYKHQNKIDTGNRNKKTIVFIVANKCENVDLKFRELCFVPLPHPPPPPHTSLCFLIPTMTMKGYIHQNEFMGLMKIPKKEEHKQ